MKYLNLNQLSDKMGGRSRSSLYRDVEEGRIPAPIKIGSRLYWVESAVDDAIASAQQHAA
ncbi:MAG TPA: transcriptional regulator [Sulfitobacter sp.]|jgi:predicted DNA-binding transcriptional regulator AlpA|nr:transcriptional regulator [Sulfitobacter sp.]|tara:strand:- start:19 stop:198 length:180 start_codon:yes stop_codon:yes gene_type:complete